MFDAIVLVGVKIAVSQIDGSNHRFWLQYLPQDDIQILNCKFSVGQILAKVSRVFIET